MIVDLGHSSKRTDFVFFDMPPPRPASALGASTPATRSAIAFSGQTPKRVRVRWYFAPEGAKPIPGGTIWASTDWSSIYELADAEMGEVPRTGTSRGNNGKAPLGATGQHHCGKSIDFRQAKVWNPSAPTLKRGATGLPICCSPATSAAVAFCGPIRAVGRIGLLGTVAAAQVGLTGSLPGPTTQGVIGLAASITTDEPIGLSCSTTADGDIEIAGDPPAEENIELASWEDPIPEFTDGEVGLTGIITGSAIGLTSASSEQGDVGIGGNPPASDDIGLASWQGPIPELTPGEVGLTGSVAEEGLGLVEDLPASDTIGFTSWSGPTPEPTPGEVGLTGSVAADQLGIAEDMPANDDVGLLGWSGETPDYAGGEVGLSGETVTPPDPGPADGVVGLGGPAAAASAVGLDGNTTPNGTCPTAEHLDFDTDYEKTFTGGELWFYFLKSELPPGTLFLDLVKDASITGCIVFVLEGDCGEFTVEQGNFWESGTWTTDMHPLAGPKCCIKIFDNGTGSPPYVLRFRLHPH